jgi:hypothetical protein
VRFEPSACASRPTPGLRCCCLLVAAVVLAAAGGVTASPPPPKVETPTPFEDEPLLPETISEQDILMQARYVRQWKEADGTLVLLMNGGFQLAMGGRHLAARDAVVWIRSTRSQPDGRRYHDLTVYLSEDAEVSEAAGTTTQDQVLLVSNLRTYGRIVKMHDAHSPEMLETSPLYLKALADRQRVEAAAAPSTAPSAAPEIARPALAGPPKKRVPRAILYRFGAVEPAETPDGEQVFIATGRVYVAQAGDPESPAIEITAQNAVVLPVEGAARTLLGDGKPQSRPATQAASGPAGEARAEGPVASRPGEDRGWLPDVSGGLESRIRAVYLEGDVVLSAGNRFMRASRLFYDFEHDRALILDGVFREDLPDRKVPLYVRADEIRQLSAREYAADNARVSTSEFHTPHYYVGAERVFIKDRTARDASGQPADRIVGTYELHHSTLNVLGVPMLYWPYSRGDLEQSETLLRRVRTGYSDEFGFELETVWYLFNLLGVEAPPGFDADLKLDYFSERGPGVGVNSSYERDDYYGFAKTYYIHDDGEDDFGPYRDNTPDTHNRGRILWRHRHYLPNDWELTLEFAYASDPGFLEEYEKEEWFEGKDQETVFYLKRAREVDAITFLANWRTLDFITMTEHLPEVVYRRIGDTFASPFVLYHESRIGDVRFQPDDRYLIDEERYDNLSGTDVTVRGDLRQEAELPLKLGALNVVPFGSVRGTYWDGQPLLTGSQWRGLGVIGARGGIPFTRTYDGAESDLLDIHRIRHIIRPEVAAWWGQSNLDSVDLTPFDYGVDTIDGFYGAKAGVRQTWQTRRGAGDKQRTVDLLALNVEAGFFGDTDGREDASDGWVSPYRPENSRTRNYLATDVTYRISDSTSLLYDFNLDLNDGTFDQQNVSFTVERSPRLAYVLGWRSANDIDLNVVGGGFNYKAGEKHIWTVRDWYDIDRGQNGALLIGYVRRLPRWFVAVTVEVDQVFDDTSVLLSIWPEGVPEWTLGSRQFTFLGTSTGIKP